jgi:flagellum-specific ATP synthase
LVARYRQSEDLILVGAYKEGVNKALDRAVRAQDSINAYLRQDIDQPAALPSSVEDLIGLAKRVS